MDVLSVLVGAFGGAAVFGAVLWNIWRRAPSYVVRWDGTNLSGFRARVSPGGIQVRSADGPITYPANAARKVVVNRITGVAVYVVAAEEIPLVQHEALEVGRQGIAFAAMFKSEGDIMRYVRMAGAIVPLAVALYLYMQFGTIQSSLTAQSADTKAALVVLQRLAPAPAATEVPK